MRTLTFFGGVALAALVPSIANAETSCEKQRTGRVVSTVAGAGVGGVAGNVIAGKGDKTLGTVIGAVVGGVVGNQIAKPDHDCSRAYGYYDKQGRWHATAVRSSDARGYYNRDGDWVDGAPDGYYRDGRWISYSANTTDRGTYDRDGHWVPAGADGYYDRNDRWIASPATGYYDTKGRWVAGTTTGHYDRNGRWLSGQASGRYDSNGNWTSDPEPGYYDTNGRWHPGETRGYYDSRGRWISDDGRYDTGNSYNQTASAMPSDIRGQINWIDSYIRESRQNGQLSRRESDRALRDLNAIRSSERTMARNRDGQLTVRNEAMLQVRLDRLSDRLRLPTRQAYNN
jgi:Glycine zipper 2TM domain